jgi:hypothetical protein
MMATDALAAKWRRNHEKGSGRGARTLASLLMLRNRNPNVASSLS